MPIKYGIRISYGITDTRQGPNIICNIRTSDWQKIELGTYVFVAGDTDVAFQFYLESVTPPDATIVWVDGSLTKLIL